VLNKGPIVLRAETREELKMTIKKLEKKINLSST
jgi:hypothetical protein